MPRIAKITIIIIVATLAIAAKQLLPGSSLFTPIAPEVIGASVSPEDMMKNAGPLPETKVEHYY